MSKFPHHAGGVLRVNHTSRWGAVPEALLEDDRLSLDARAVAAWLGIKSNGWTIKVDYLRSKMGLGKQRWERIARELINGGYYERRKFPGERGRWCWEIVFTPVPTVGGLAAHGGSTGGAPVDGVAAGGTAADITTPSKQHHLNINNAAAFPAAAVKKVFAKRASGIATWNTSDEQAAEKIEQQYSAEQISAAIATIGDRDAVPGLVKRALARLERAQARQALAAEEKRLESSQIASRETIERERAKQQVIVARMTAARS